jgi:hypothetical protein
MCPLEVEMQTQTTSPPIFRVSRDVIDGAMYKLHQFGQEVIERSGMGNLRAHDGILPGLTIIQANALRRIFEKNPPTKKYDLNQVYRVIKGAANTSPIECSIGSIGIFGNRQKNTKASVSLVPNQNDLEMLQEQSMSIINALGEHIDPSFYELLPRRATRPTIPHVTIIYIQGDNSFDKAKEVQAAAYAVCREQAENLPCRNQAENPLGTLSLSLGAIRVIPLK